MNTTLKIEKAGSGYSYTIGKGDSAVSGWSASRERIDDIHKRFLRRTESPGVHGDMLDVLRKSRRKNRVLHE